MLSKACSPIDQFARFECALEQAIKVLVMCCYSRSKVVVYISPSPFSPLLNSGAWEA
jgi:hypothetical protein